MPPSFYKFIVLYCIVVPKSLFVFSLDQFVSAHVIRTKKLFVSDPTPNGLSENRKANRLRKLHNSIEGGSSRNRKCYKKNSVNKSVDTSRDLPSKTKLRKISWMTSYVIKNQYNISSFDKLGAETLWFQI